MERYPSETRIMLALKKRGKLSLSELSEEIGISKMAVLNHIKKLEGKSLVERSIVKSNVGRPYYVFRTSINSKEGLSESQTEMLDELIDYLDRTGNDKVVTEFLKERYSSVRVEYEKRLSRLPEQKRVEALTRIREEENYYPELKEAGSDGYELLEYNCPIFKISNRFGIACSLETQLFSSVLQMDVKSTHRQVNGSEVCRFHIKKRSE